MILILLFAKRIIMGVVAVPDLRAMLGVVKCPLREAFLY